MRLHQAGEQHQPPHRLDRRRHRRFVERLERRAEPLADLRIADRDQPRQQEAAARAAHERILDRAQGAVARHQHDPAGKPGLAFAEARDQPRRQRVREGAVGGMVKTLRCTTGP